MLEKNSERGVRLSMRKRIPFMFVVVIFFVLLGGLSFAVDMYFDWLWFQEIGKATIFTTTLYAKGSVFSATLFVVFLFLYLNLWYAHRGPGTIQIGIPTPSGQITAYTFPDEQIRRILGLLSLGIAFVLAIRSAQRWEIIWRWLHSVNFDVQDRVFARDIGFYFFSLPVFEEVVRLGLVLCFFSGVGVLVLYYFKGALSLPRIRTFGRGSRVRRHVSLLAALAFLLLAADAYISRFQILFSNHGGPLYGATYTDLNARLPMLSLLAAAALLGAVLWVYNAFSSTYRGAIGAAALYVVFIVAGRVYPAMVHRFIVAPNELGRESPQIQHNIEATIQGYGLDNVQERNLSGDKALTPADIRANAATIQSIRLWDHEPLLDTFSQIQEIRTYYDFTSVDNDRYTLNGLTQQMMLSARELNSASLPDRKWINEHLQFTHGYGLTLGPVNRVTTEGLPVLLVQDIPPRSAQPTFKIDRPEIYFGELTTGYVVVKTGEQEFDYPAGEENVFTSYQGSGGVPVNSFFRKLLFAFYFKDANIVLSPLLKSESRFLYFRDIKSRVRRVAPFLLPDKDPYLVISDGKLYWIQDAYTVGDRYPYSTPTIGVGNYMRNSVKLVIDAYNGNVELYIADRKDPLIKVYQSIFPGIFRPLSDLSEDLRRHLRYPEDIFTVQSYVYAVYHMTNTQAFYNKEDLWEIPALGTQGNQSSMSPYYTIMRLPQEKREEFILMLPFTPGRKDNLSAWMVARSDGDQYGQLVVYRFPKQKLIYGPRQIVARINQDAEISRQISLWDQRGSQVIQGTLLVIPIEEALLYVRPLYLRAEAGKIPELKRVIVAYENKIAMEETLEGALARIFQGDRSTPPPPEPSSTQTSAPSPASEATKSVASSELIRQARETFDRATQAQRQGEWAKYGEEQKRLGAILEELSKNPGR
jgi:uncharacterized membrane protein (UPF0182 family)